MKRSTSLALGALLAAALSLASACSATLDLQIETTPAAEATIAALQAERSRLATKVAHQELRLGRLAYVQGGDVWVNDLPDGEPRRLTDDGRNSQPRWSPSGEWLAFHKGEYEAWVIRSDGEDARPLNDGAAVDAFAWSPVDDRLAYVAGNELRTVSAADGSATVLSDTDGDPLTPPPEGGRRIGQIAWSPGGRWIAYERRKQSQGGPPEKSLWKVSAEGGEPVRLYPDDQGEIGGPMVLGWTGDGRFLLIQDDMNSASLLADGSPLYALPAGGGSPVPLAQSVLAHADFVVPAPSSDRVAVVVGGFRVTWENKALHVIQPSSREGRSLTPPEQAVSSPAWSPDGRRIAYVAMSDQAGEDVAGGEPAHQALMQRRIWLMEADGSGGRPLTDDSTYRSERPLWSADGSHILFAHLDAEDRASLWLTSVEGGNPQQVVEELTPAPEWFGYYGHVEWDQWFDWWRGSVERSEASGASMLPANPTPPPANWTPTPPSKREQADDWRDWLRGYFTLVTDMLNAAGDVDAVLERLVSWMPGETSQGSRPHNAWAQADDLDDDGVDEWLISVPEPDRRCAIPWCPAYIVLFEKQDALFTPVHLVQDDRGSYQLSHPVSFRIADVNADGQTEVVVRAHGCGAHTCHTTLVIGRWDGERWHDLTADVVEQATSEVTLDDRYGDGIQEIAMHGGIIKSAGAGLQREYTLVFGWRDGAYRQIEYIPDPDDHPYYRVLDANAALADGNLEKALALAMEVVSLNGRRGPEAMGGSEHDYHYAWPRIVAYASIEAMLVHDQRGDAEGMEDLYFNLAARSLGAPNNPYPDAAWRLLETYRETSDPLRACQAMEAFAAERAADAPFFGTYGYATERVTVDQLCPLDKPPETPEPEL